MAFTLTDTTYAGEAAAGFIVKAMTGFETVQGGHVYVKDNIKKKYTIPRIEVEDIIQDPNPTPVSQGDTTITGQTLEPKEWLIYLEFNPNDFEDHWSAIELDDELLDRSLPKTAESVITQEVLKLNAKHLETALWQSVLAGAAPYKYFNGFVKRMTDGVTAGTVIPVGTYAALSTANIFAKLAASIALVPDALQLDPNTKIFVSRATFQIYAEAQKAVATKGVDVTQRGVDMFDGYKVVPLVGVPNNTIIVARGTADLSSNLWMGINSKSDENNLKVAQLQANSDLWFIKGKMKADVNFGFGEEIVFYHSTNP
jgi:hypothetical protein